MTPPPAVCFAVALLSVVPLWKNAFSLVLPGPSTTTSTKDAFNATVFVGGLRKPCNREVLQSCLERDYGKVSQLSILNEKSTNSYAFATFFNPDDAQMAIADYLDGIASAMPKQKHQRGREDLPYQEIKPTKNNKKNDCRKGDSKTSSSNVHERKLELDRRLDMARYSTVVLQVHRSHLERLHRFLIGTGTKIKAFPTTSDSLIPQSDQILGQIVDTGSSCSTVALLLLEGISSNDILDWIDFHLPFPLVGLNKVYSVDSSKGILRGGVKDILRHWTKEVSDLVHGTDKGDKGRGSSDRNSPIKFRMQVFPRSLHDEILAELKKNMSSNANHNDNNDYSILSSRLSPTQNTHSLTAVQIWSSADDSDGLGELYLTGLSRKRQPPASMAGYARNNILTKSVTTKERIGDEILCRAYHKLEEAFFRYGSRYELPKGMGKVAVDCGAAPGGWTQYLLDDNAHPSWSCRAIYSIDPGVLNPIVASNPKTRHLPVCAEDALGPLSEEHRGGIDIWVSDMCVHRMEYQIDILFEAMDKGVVRSDTFFVITLKCNRGHSKESFDRQVEEQTRRLDGFTRDVLTIHLLSNRLGERTIIGYVI